MTVTEYLPGLNKGRTNFSQSSRSQLPVANSPILGHEDFTEDFFPPFPSRTPGRLVKPPFHDANLFAIADKALAGMSTLWPPI